MAMNWLSAVAARFTSPQPLHDLRPALGMAPLGRQNTAQSRDMYRVLRAYYKNNALYDVIQDLLRRQGVAHEAIKGIRNPTYRVVEFHAGHLWPGTLPGALPIMAQRDEIIAPIQQVWQWSNLAARKQVAARHIALYGDMFLKVAQTDDQRRVFMQTIEPENVTDFDSDERDFLTYVRFDVPRLRRLKDGTSERYTHTEEWSKDTGLFRVWESQSMMTSALAPIEELGEPLREVEIASMGIDFVPVVRAPFADIGEERGMGAIVPAIDKIDEANRQATRLAQLLFRHNKVTHALEANSVDSAGRPMPPPRLSDTEGEISSNGTVSIGDDEFYMLPGMSKLVQLVPNINYEAALHVLQDHMVELEQDLPELILYRISEMGSNVSGRAVRLMLAPAIARLAEARGNAESALIRANQMALTMGSNANLWDVGTYENGDFEHAFEERDVLPNDELERAQAQQADGAALASYVSAGMPIELAVQELWDWPAERAAQFTLDRLAAIQREQTLATEDVTEEDGATA